MITGFAPNAAPLTGMKTVSVLVLVAKKQSYSLYPHQK